MAIKTPSIQEIQNRLMQDFDSEFGGVIALLSRSFFSIWSKILAGAFYLDYKFAQRVSLNILPTTAEGDQLDLYASQFSDFYRQFARPFSGKANVTGAENTKVRAGIIFVSPAGIEYIVTKDTIIVEEQAEIEIEALTTDNITNLDVSSKITLITPVHGLDSSATIIKRIKEGADEESDSNFRTRLIERYRLRPQGGSKIDYVIWGKTVTGVTRVFPYSWFSNIVQVYFLRDNDENRIPNGGQIKDVISAIDQPYRRPVGAFLQVLIPTEISFILKITNFSGDETASENLEKAIKDYFLSKEMYVDDNLSRPGCNEIKYYEIIFIISQYGSAGEVELFLNNNTITNHTLNQGEVAKLATLGFE